MFKAIYGFTKMFSILFFIMAIFFVIKDMALLAIVAILSFLIIRFIDSDWAFDAFKLANHNALVILITFFLIFVNLFFIYQELKYSPILIKVTKEDQEHYITYENSLYEALNPCIVVHNELMQKQSSSTQITPAEIKKANLECYNVIDEIDKQVIPNNFPQTVKGLCFETKDHFKKIAISLATYNYSPETSQTALAQRIKDNLGAAIKKMSKTRIMMHLPDELEDNKKAFINL